jgi:hypothetical protein
MVEVTTRIGRQTITSWRPPTETSGPVMLQTETDDEWYDDIDGPRSVKVLEPRGDQYRCWREE